MSTISTAEVEMHLNARFSHQGSNPGLAISEGCFIFCYGSLSLTRVQKGDLMPTTRSLFYHADQSHIK